MNKIIIAFLLSTAIFSCKKQVSENLPAPLEEIKRLSGNCVCDPYINLYTWRNQPVYLLGYAGPACSWIPTYYNEKGEIITMPVGYTVDMFAAESRLVKNVWRCSGL
jgi:hypothetical protein